MTATSKKIFLGVIIVIVVIVAGFYAYTRSSNVVIEEKARKTYSSDLLGMTLTYPENFSLSEKESSSGGDKQQPIILTLHSPQGRILIVPSVRSTSEVEKERNFYESFLFNEAQSVNSRVDYGKFRGFKSAPGLENSLFTMYTQKNETESLTLRTEITASSSDALSAHEQVLLSIFDSVSFK